MRIELFVALAVTLAACEKNDTAALEKADQKLDERIAQLERAGVGASGGAGTSRIAELEKKVDVLSKQVEELEQKLSTQVGAARPPTRTRAQPDPKDVYAVPVDGDPMDGPADALVTIVEGYEYACPYCEKVNKTLAELRTIYGKDLRVVKKQFVVHPQVATAPAQAACAAHRQGRFAAMDALLWEKAYAVRKYDEAHLETLAGEARLDLSRYRRDFTDCAAKVQEDMTELKQVGQGATPTFYVNGRFMSGAQPLATFQAMIDEELKQAKDRVAQGTPRAQYYQRWIIDRGLPRFIPPPTGP